jgi:hypothetical protein
VPAVAPAPNVTMDDSLSKFATPNPFGILGEDGGPKDDTVMDDTPAATTLPDASAPTGHAHSTDVATCDATVTDATTVQRG